MPSQNLVKERLQIGDLERWRSLPLEVPSISLLYKGAASLPYRLYTPTNPSGKSPLIVYLHHAMAVGTDNVQSVRASEAVGRMIEGGVRSEFNAYLLVPQSAGHWESGDWGLTPSPLSNEATPTLAAVKALIDDTVTWLGLVSPKIILIGQSMGAFGVWDALGRWPNYFSAAAVVCGGGDPGSINSIASTPVWAFHGDADTVIPVERTRMMVQELERLEADFKYSEYAQVDHDECAWLAWSEPDLVAWLLSKDPAIV